ncbi:MAG TPA: prepilin-type N-terminal cleavage/methylation domain-containing protein [Candidatus Woesebacteria bacterium]|nr:prepilin-type N-terminal cleavage/methylation domain-containing protein [Candidatus Woesebacteria bacterium]
MKQHKGYTLFELVVTVSLLVIVLLGGTTIFFRSFRSSGVSDIQSTVNSGLRAVAEMIERTLRYGTVMRVIDSDGVQKTREDCILAAKNNEGVVGYSLVVKDSVGGTAIYSLSDGVVSSNSGVVISSPDVYVTKMQFTWYCRSGVNDRINLLVEATSSATSGEGYSGELARDINLLNSGIY